MRNNYKAQSHCDVSVKRIANDVKPRLLTCPMPSSYVPRYSGNNRAARTIQPLDNTIHWLSNHIFIKLYIKSYNLNL